VLLVLILTLGRDSLMNAISQRGFLGAGCDSISILSQEYPLDWHVSTHEVLPDDAAEGEPWQSYYALYIGDLEYPLDEPVASSSMPAYLDHFDSGNQAYGHERYEQAIAHYDQAIQAHTGFGYAYAARANAKRKLEHYPEAIADYDQAILLAPEFTHAYNGRGLARAELGDYRQAILDYDEALRHDPDHATAYANRARAREAMGTSVEDAADDWADAYGNLAFFESDALNCHKQAIASYDQALLLRPHDATHSQEPAGPL